MYSFDVKQSLPILLGVNIDHIATLRNVRGTVYPNPVTAASIVRKSGADIITMHLREDRRHINDFDVELICSNNQNLVNLECSLNNEILLVACRVKPYSVCIVPEKRNELTTEGGLELTSQITRVTNACIQLQETGIQVSLFIDADPTQIDAAAKIGVNFIEIHTGRYANAQNQKICAYELNRIISGVKYAKSLGLRINAGHGLHYTNVQQIAALSAIQELNIGHSLIAHAVFVGLANAVREMKSIITAVRLSTNDNY